MKTAIQKLSDALTKGSVKAVVGPQGAIAFQNWSNEALVSDACAYRLIMATGTATARLAIARAEQLAGRTVSKQALSQGHHSHDGGGSWHGGH